ncbi:MAG: flagellar export chaperone FliS [Sulfuritalea sp.]|nr:flagellar export chaperone FliS [Sulfuritalea sp.]
MFTSASMKRRQNPAAAYTAIGLETGVPSADPHKLVLMLFEGALVSIASAKNHMQLGNTAEKGMAVSKAIDIVSNGLKASIDFEAGGELADKLGALYDYMANRLLFANLHHNVAALDEVFGLLSEIKSAWEEIAGDPAVASRNKVAA